MCALGSRATGHRRRDDRRGEPQKFAKAAKRLPTRLEFRGGHVYVKASARNQLSAVANGATLTARRDYFGTCPAVISVGRFVEPRRRRLGARLAQQPSNRVRAL